MAVQKITAWSYSRLRDWETCPFKAKQKHVLKMKEPDSPAMARGSAIHKLAEDYVKGDLKKIPKELVNFKKEFDEIRKVNQVFVEEQLTFNAKFELMGADGWFDRSAWCRVKMDLRAIVKGVMRLIDHKTGKVKDDHIDQLEFYALVGFILEPDIDTVAAELWYLDQAGKERIRKETFYRKNFDKIKGRWLKRVKPMLVDTAFHPKPNPTCKFCFFNANDKTYQGAPKPKGPCRFK